MTRTPPTPEQLIRQMPEREIQQLLADLELDHSAAAATVFRHQVSALGSLETALQSLAAPQSRRRAG